MTMRPNLNVRNNNPLNIRYAAGNDWVGQVGQSGGFAKFDTPEHGFRAGAKLILNYRSNHGLYSIASIISRWAPPEDDNHTDEYIKFVEEKTGIWSWRPIFESEIPGIMLAMSEFEGAKGAFTLEQAQQGAALV